MIEESTTTRPARGESTRGLNRVFKSLLLVLAIGAIGSVVYFGSLMEAVAGVYSDKVEPMPFDSAVWRATLATQSHDTVRLRMSDDLVTNVLETGMHESVVHQLLGYPDPYEPFTGYDFMYYLGGGPDGAAYDGVWLAFKLNNRAEVQFFKVATE